MNPKLRWVLFVALCAAQLAAAASLIHRQQRALADGTPYRFRTAPVDPADPFRGKYVSLDFEAACVRPGREFARRARVYGTLAVDAQGYARIAALTPGPPPSGDYLRLRVARWNCEGGTRVELPFDRYYLPEDMAADAETAYRSVNRAGADEDGRVPAYASVRVREGYAALEELYLDGQPVRDYVRAVRASPATP